MGLLDFDLDKVLQNPAFMLGMNIHGANSGNYGQLGPALSGGLNNYAQQQHLLKNRALEKLKLDQQQKVFEQQQKLWEQQQADRQATMKATGGIPFDLYKYQNPPTEKTTLERQLIAAGFQPGTPAYKNAMLLGISNGNYMGGSPDLSGNQKPSSPMGAYDPSSVIRDPKERDKFRAKTIQDNMNSLEAGGKELGIAQQNISEMRRFKQLSQTNETGGFTSLGPMGWARNKLDPEHGVMDSISNKMIPQMRQGLPGAASDRDVAMFAKSTISIDNPNETNDAIADAYIAAEQNKIDKHAFKQMWFESNNGSLVGAEAAWNRYLNEEPIFDHTKTTPMLNAKRRSWQQYFGLESDGITSIKRIK